MMVVKMEAKLEMKVETVAMKAMTLVKAETKAKIERMEVVRVVVRVEAEVEVVQVVDRHK